MNPKYSTTLIAGLFGLSLLSLLIQLPARADSGVGALIGGLIPIIRDQQREAWYGDAYGVVTPGGRIVIGLSAAEAGRRRGVFVPPNSVASVVETSGIHKVLFGVNRYVGVEATYSASRASALRECRSDTFFGSCIVVRSKATKSR